MPDPRLLPQPPLVDEALAVIVESLQRIRFGLIAITVHDGKIVQLDISEKRRLVRAP